MSDMYDYSDGPDLTPEDREAILDHLHENMDAMLDDPENTSDWNSKYVDEL